MDESETLKNTALMCVYPDDKLYAMKSVPLTYSDKFHERLYHYYSIALRTLQDDNATLEDVEDKLRDFVYVAKIDTEWVKRMKSDESKILRATLSVYGAHASEKSDNK